MLDKNKTYILLGYSGHAFVVAEAFMLSGGKIYGYADSSESEVNPFNLAYVGSEKEEDFPFWEKNSSFILGIGDNFLRTKVASLVRNKGKNCLVVIHPGSSISSSVSIGSGTFVARNAAVNPFCEIGEDVILNTSCSIDHECIVRNGAHIAPGAVLAGNVKVGSHSFIGANSVIKQGVVIGDNVVIGAGSVVLNNVPSNSRLVGNPARKL